MEYLFLRLLHDVADTLKQDTSLSKRTHLLFSTSAYLSQPLLYAFANEAFPLSAFPPSDRAAVHSCRSYLISHSHESYLIGHGCQGKYSLFALFWKMYVRNNSKMGDSTYPVASCKT